ncbi:MAG: PQQ-dependent sugar dehydrogenase, partial [Nitrososphaeraceae archaeon]
MQSLSSIVSRSTFIFLISFLAILVSVVVCSGDVSSVYAKKLKSYEGISIIEPGLTFQPLVSGFAFPTGMAFVDPDNILVIEKNTGRVIQIRNGTEMKEPLLDVNVANMSERGLLGIAISHNNNNISAPPYVFLYYTETEDKDGTKILGNRLYRYELVNNTLINPKLLLDLPYLPGPSHDGGVVKIGPDNKSVYLVIGNLNFMQNETYMTKAQNVKDGPAPDGRGGILRVTFDGDVVGGKGILGDSEMLNKYYGYGLRNSFGIGFDPVTGNLWDTENGQSMNDEINLVKPGFNSGWRIIQGPSFLQKDFDKKALEDFDGKGVYRDPEFDWLQTIAPTSVLFFNSDKMGKKYENDLFVASVKNGTIYHFDLNEA